MIIKKRCFLHISGYDPVPAENIHTRYSRGYEKFLKLWNLQGQLTPCHTSSETCEAIWTSQTSGKIQHDPLTRQDFLADNWQVQSDYVLLTWDDLIRNEAKISALKRLYEGLKTGADFLFSGTAWRYITHQWHYAGFFFFPYLLLAGFIALACLAANYLTPLLFTFISHALPHWFIQFFSAAIIFSLLYACLGRAFRLQDALDDWNFARSYMRGTHEEAAQRFALFAARVEAYMQDQSYDEIILVGHSLGATIVMDVMAQVLRHRGAQHLSNSKITVLTVGATIPKFLLHPGAQLMKNSVQAIVNARQVDWIEVQSRRDYISFYKVHPLKLKRINQEDLEGKPLIRFIRMQEMFSKATWKKFRFRVMRFHYQFLMANERRAAYDFFMLCCGPLSIRMQMLHPQGAMGFFNDAGALDLSQMTNYANISSNEIFAQTETPDRYLHEAAPIKRSHQTNET